MKLSNTMVSALVIGAVLVSAYALGLVIREVRTSARPAAPAASAPTAPAEQRPGPGAAATKDTPAGRAQVREARAKTLEKMGASTKEEQAQFRDKVIKQAGGRRGGKGPGGLTPEERQARRAKAQGQSQAAGETPDANTPTAPKENTDLKQNAEKAGATP